MKRYIYLTLTIIFGIIAFNFDWLFEGQSAIEAAKQVLTGFNYQEARAKMIFWERVQTATNVGFWVSLAFFISTFFNKKTTNEKQ